MNDPNIRNNKFLKRIITTYKIQSYGYQHFFSYFFKNKFKRKKFKYIHPQLEILSTLLILYNIYHYKLSQEEYHNRN